MLFFSKFNLTKAKLQINVVFLSVELVRKVKRLDKYILKSYLGPLALTFSIAIFVLLLQFLWKQIEKIVGKGLEVGVIFEMIAYACATLVPMALPLSILLASIMTMGNFGERYELVAMKSSGLSLWRIFRPLIWLSLCFCGLAFVFSNNVIPKATTELRLLLYEINTKKPALNIKPNEFYSEIENYTIRIGSKDKSGKHLKDIIIYDHSKDMGNISVTIADSGQMYSEDEGNTLVFRLFSGYTFEEDIEGENMVKRPLMRVDYTEQLIRFDVSDFAYQKTDENRYDGHYKMLNVIELKHSLDTIRKAEKEYCAFMQRRLFDMINSEEVFKRNSVVIDCNKEKKIISRHKALIEQIEAPRREYYQSEIENYEMKLKADEDYLRRHQVEFHRKFTLSAACIILFFIGAPLGAIIRKGGLGMPVVVSTLAFVIYYIVGQVGENMAIEAKLPVWLGMWLSSLIFLPIGLFLTVKATSDSSVLSSEAWTKFFTTIKHKIKIKKDKQNNEDTANLL